VRQAVSIQFGRLDFDGCPVDHHAFARAAAFASKYQLDDERTLVRDNLGMMFCSFHTTTESKQERQPMGNMEGMLLTWDGRLDNRGDLMRRIGGLQTGESASDASIVLRAYELWGVNSFREFLGDWALAIWDPTLGSVVLAKDFLGPRHLYYSIDGQCLTWSTVLEPLLTLRTNAPSICEEYIAGYLSVYPATHLTPFTHISAVPAGTYVTVNGAKTSTNLHWQFDPDKHIRYRTDAEYEDHLRVVLRQSVRRRLRSCFPVLAELSGGMDSSTIVCTADLLLRDGQVDTPRLDTISYFDDEEVNWNERPYVSVVENDRGRQGHHIDIGNSDGFLEQPGAEFLFLKPGYDRRAVDGVAKVVALMLAGNNRVLLSGIGGDEVLGGVPIPIPEIQDLLVSFRWAEMTQQLFRWSLKTGRPWVHILLECLREFLPLQGRLSFRRAAIPSWLSKEFVRRNAEAFSSDACRVHWLGASPSFQANVNTLNHVRRKLGCGDLTPFTPYRLSFPYLDRDVVEFALAVPRQQILRPGQRRSLMRRALVGIVPEEILHRRRKAYISRRPLERINRAWGRVQELCTNSCLSLFGIADPTTLLRSIRAAKEGRGEDVLSLISAMKLEVWLRSFAGRGTLPLGMAAKSAHGDTHPPQGLPELPANVAGNGLS
jgi:asparagine synthase (glutamine-hydrolysing)